MVIGAQQAQHHVSSPSRAASFCCFRAAQEPQNAHSHLLSMVLGNSETVPVTGGKLALGQWQVGVHGCGLDG